MGDPVARGFEDTIKEFSRIRPESIVVVQNDKDRPSTVKIDGTEVKNSLNPHGLVFDPNGVELEEESIHSDKWKKLWQISVVELYEWPAYKALEYFSGAAGKSSVTKSGVTDENLMKLLETERKTLVGKALDAELKRKRVSFREKKLQIDEINEQLSLLQPLLEYNTDKCVLAAKTMMRNILLVMQIILDTTLIDFFRNNVDQYFQRKDITELYPKIENGDKLTIIDFYHLAREKLLQTKMANSERDINNIFEVLAKKETPAADNLRIKLATNMGLPKNTTLDAIASFLKTQANEYYGNYSNKTSLREPNAFQIWFELIGHLESSYFDDDTRAFIKKNVLDLDTTQRIENSRRMYCLVIFEAIILRSMVFSVVDNVVLGKIQQQPQIHLKSKNLSYTAMDLFKPDEWFRADAKNLKWAFPSFVWFMLQFLENHTRLRQITGDIEQPDFFGSTVLAPTFSKWEPKTIVNQQTREFRVQGNSVTNAISEYIQTLTVSSAEKDDSDFVQLIRDHLFDVWNNVILLARQIEDEHVIQNDENTDLLADPSRYMFATIGTAFKVIFENNIEIFVEAVMLWLVFCNTVLDIISVPSRASIAKEMDVVIGDLADEIHIGLLDYETQASKIEATCFDMLSKSSNKTSKWILTTAGTKEFIANRTWHDMKIISESLFRGIQTKIAVKDDILEVFSNNRLTDVIATSQRKRKRNSFLPDVSERSVAPPLPREQQSNLVFGAVRANARATQYFQLLFSFDSAKESAGPKPVLSLTKHGIQFYNHIDDIEENVKDISPFDEASNQNPSVWKLDIENTHSLLSLFQKMAIDPAVNQILPLVNDPNFDTFNKLFRLVNPATGYKPFSPQKSEIFKSMYNMFVTTNNFQIKTEFQEVWTTALTTVWPESNMFVVILEILAYVQEMQPKIRKDCEHLLRAKESAERDMRNAAEGRIDLQVMQIAREAPPTLSWVLEPINTRLLVISADVNSAISEFYNDLKDNYPTQFADCPLDAFTNPIGKILTDVCKQFMACAGKRFTIAEKRRATDREIAIAQDAYVRNCDIFIRNWRWEKNSLATRSDGYSPKEIEFLNSEEIDGKFVSMR